jgi:bacteriorhodopsin
MSEAVSTTSSGKVDPAAPAKSPLFGTVRMTFYITYILLITTGTITLIEALRTPNAAVRHVMNLETCISVIAGYFYSQFIEKVNLSNGVLNYLEINEMRYNDWFITTPLMILVLMMSLSYSTGRYSVHFGTFVLGILLNFGMLFSGYLGEKGTISKKTGCAVGFLFFVLLFGLIYVSFVRDSGKMFNYVFFGLYVGIWSMYGVTYLLDEETKNIIYNVLDVTAKCFVGLGLWAYFTKIIVE